VSRQKEKGTRFETACVRYLRKRLEDDRIDRCASHGNRDQGDIGGLVAHGYKGIVECKDYKSWSRSDLLDWQSQTVVERGNADADFALLVAHRKGVGETRFGENACHLQVRDLERVMGGEFTCLAGDTAKEMWIRADLETICKFIMSDYKEEE
jgi:hypothetical protein